jgi:predicted transcriptional regulator
MPTKTEKQIEQALRKANGFQTQAGEILGISQQAISKRIKTSKRLQKVVEELNESNLDVAENELFKLVKGGNLGAICFLLKCKGKDRGYVERQEFTGAGGAALEVTLKWPENGVSHADS